MTPDPFDITKRSVKETNVPGIYRDARLPGFCLRVRASGEKYFIVIRKLKGTQKNITVTLGRDGTMTPDQARNKALQVIAQLAAGINPNEEHRERVKQEKKKHQAKAAEDKVKTLTLRKAANDFLTSRNLKENTRYIYGLLINRYLEDWLQKPLIEISKDMVEKRHQKLSDHPAQANHILRILRAIFNYAIVAYESDGGQPIITENPVKRISQLGAWHRISRRQTVVKAHQLPQWYAAVSALKDETSRDYLMVLLLTGLRKNEAAALTWKNVDLIGKTLTVTDTKNYQDHTLPLSDFLLENLRRRWSERGSNEYVFPSRRGSQYITNCREAVASICTDSGVQFTLHDLRRTFLTTAEQLDIPYYALKRLANHKLTADVTAGYIVTDVERLREPMQKITNELLRRCGIMKSQGKHPTKMASRRTKKIHSYFEG